MVTLFCLLLCFPEVAQNSLIIPRVFQEFSRFKEFPEYSSFFLGMWPASDNAYAGAFVLDVTVTRWKTAVQSRQVLVH